MVFKNWSMQHLSMILLKVCCVPRRHVPILRTGLLYPDSAMLLHDLLLNEAHWQRYVYPFTSLYQEDNENVQNIKRIAQYSYRATAGRTVARIPAGVRVFLFSTTSTPALWTYSVDTGVLSLA